MSENKKYKVIVSDRAKRTLGTHIRFMAQVSKEAVTAKKKELMTAVRITAGSSTDKRIIFEVVTFPKVAIFLCPKGGVDHLEVKIKAAK